MIYSDSKQTNLEADFEEMRNLINHGASQHSIKGNILRFTIGMGRFYPILTCLFIFIYGFFTILAVETALAEPFAWVVVILLSAVPVYFLRRDPLGHSIGITVDTAERIIIVFDDNIIRRKFLKREIISFADVRNIRSEDAMAGQRYNGENTGFPWKKIYLDHRYGTTQITALPDKIFTDSDAFMSCFMRIVQAGKI